VATRILAAVRISSGLFVRERVLYSLQDGQLEWDGCDHLAFGRASDGVLYSTITSFYFKWYAQICHKDGHEMRE